MQAKEQIESLIIFPTEASSLSAENNFNDWSHYLDF